MTATIRMSACYGVHELEGMEALRKCFPNGPDSVDSMNWLFTGTSGIHGSYQGAFDAEFDKHGFAYPTVLVVRPRTCVMLYGGNGRIKCSRDDLVWLQSLEKKTVEVINWQFGQGD